MSEERETTIAILAGVVDRAQQQYIQLGMTNISHLNAAERMHIDAEYQTARVELKTAQDILRQAMDIQEGNAP